MTTTTTRAKYFLVAKNTDLANTYGLVCGDIMAVHDEGHATLLREVSYGPKLPVRVRLAQEKGTLIPLEPVPEAA